MRMRCIAEPWQGEFYYPDEPTAVGVLVLAGSSGRVESERARLFAEHGIAALAIRWFGGPGQPEGPALLPLETFTQAVDFLQAEGAQRIGLVGVSKGAEASLLTAVRDPRVDVVVALSPTSHVWSWREAGKNVSSWTWRDEPLPFLALDENWPAEHAHEPAPIAIRSWYERSARVSPELLAAAIPVERTRAEIVLVAGGNDQMWPSLPFAEELVRRRSTADPDEPGAAAPIHLVTHPLAGHRPRFPGEPPAKPPTTFAYGGSRETDAALGARAWPVVLEALRA